MDIGRIVLLRSARRALGISGAGIVVVSVDGDELTLTSMRQNIRRAHGLYRAHATADASSDDFLKDRRAEAARERARPVRA